MILRHPKVAESQYLQGFLGIISAHEDRGIIKAALQMEKSPAFGSWMKHA
jgi:hypothetical protein